MMLGQFHAAESKNEVDLFQHANLRSTVEYNDLDYEKHIFEKAYLWL